MGWVTINGSSVFIDGAGQAHYGKDAGTAAAKEGGGKTSKGKAGRVSEPVASAKSERAKSTHKVSDKAKQDHAERNEQELARGLGKDAHAHPNNEPMDVSLPRAGGGEHLIEVKTFMDNGNDKVTMHKSSLARKLARSQETGDPFHTVVMDDRDTFAGGANKAQHSGHRLYYRRGVGSFRAGGMHKAKNMGEIRRLLDTPDAQLPKGAI